MYRFITYNKRDNRSLLAPLYYICIKVCERNKMKEYIPIEFDTFYWIVNKANIRHLKKYYTCAISYDFLNMFDEADYLPKTFNTDWCAKYSMLNDGKIKYIKDKPVVTGYEYEFDYSSYLSCTVTESLDYAIYMYNLYGKKLLFIKHCINKVLLLLNLKNI